MKFVLDADGNAVNLERVEIIFRDGLDVCYSANGFVGTLAKFTDNVDHAQNVYDAKKYIANLAKTLNRGELP